MRCPACGSLEVAVTGTEARVMDDLVSTGLIKRWRVCQACGARWRTYEEWDRRDVWRRDATGKQEIFNEA